MSWVWIAVIGSLIVYSEHRKKRRRAAQLEQTGTKQKARWWREVLTAFVVALVVSTYYSTKLSHSQRRAEQAEAQLERMQHKGAFEVTPESIGAVPVDAPRDLVCPDGTKLQYRRIIDLTQDSNAQTREWECIGKPRRVGAPPLPRGNWRKVN